MSEAPPPVAAVVAAAVPPPAAGSPKALGNALSQPLDPRSTTSFLDLPVDIIHGIVDLLFSKTCLPCLDPPGINLTEHVGCASLRLTCRKLNSLVLARATRMVFEGTSKQTDETFLLPLRLFENTPRLRLLDLERCQELPLSLVGLPTTITSLNLRGLSDSRIFPLLDLSPLSKCIGLQDLDISYLSSVEDLSPLAACKHLESLTIGCCSAQISLHPLANCTKLRFIDLCNTCITDLSPLSACKDLETIQCWGSLVSDLSPLSVCSKLREVDCYGTAVSDLSPLSACLQLEKVDCKSTYVEDIASLAACTQLTSIECNRDVTGLYSDEEGKQDLESGQLCHHAAFPGVQIWVTANLSDRDENLSDSDDEYHYC